MTDLKRTLFIALILLAVSGLMLHYRIHNFMVQDKLDPNIFTFDGTRFLAFLFPFVDLVVVSILFTRSDTVVYGYLLNGLIVIYGTVFMAHFSLADFAAHNVPTNMMLLKSTLPDIGLSWVDFLVGKALYDSYMKGDAAAE